MKRNKKETGDIVKIKSATINGRKKLVPIDYDQEHEIKDYIIICEPDEDKNQYYYMILVDQDMAGWTISQFHVIYKDISEKYLYQKFFEVNEDYIL